MDFGYVWYDANKLERSFWSKKAQIDSFFRWLFLADSIKKAVLLLLLSDSPNLKSSIINFNQ
jgi:hypothetical protein